MMAHSLRWRLLLGAAIAIFATLAVAWMVMTWLFDRQLERQAEQELRRDALELVGDLKADANGAIPMLDGPGDARFDTPASGLYWQVSGPSGTQRSRSLWDQVLPPTPADALDWHSRFIDGPFGHRLFLLDRIVQPEGTKDTVLVQLALDDELLDAAGAEFGQTLALFLVLIWAALSCAAWLQVELGLRPLRTLKLEIASLRLNPAERLSASYPSEVEPLTRAINDLASAREADVKRARQRAADLAHGMKTPLAALAAQSRLIREGKTENSRAASDGLDRAIAAAAAAVEGELARARAAASRLSHQDEKAAPLTVVQRLISVLERTEKGMRVDYQLEIPEALRLAIGEEDLTEILGPLLENAVKFARRQVRVTSRPKDGKTLLSIEDDGPGIKVSEMADVMVRGARLDQAGGGHGLGLAIARELVEATGGTIALGESSLSGLRVDLSW
jgi:signal transduction histidine kinase